MADACRRDNGNPGYELGRELGSGWVEGRDKICIAETEGDFGLWAEQLIAESTGKHGKGLVPAPGESPDGADRQSAEPQLPDPYALGAEFFRWEFAIAVAGVSELTGWMRRVRWGRRSAWVAGATSGALGGMVGNQGGIRTAALLGFDVPKESFVATATAIGLFVDGARMPVYLATEWRDIVGIWPLVLVATIGVVVGTALGARVLGRLPQRLFRRVIAVLLVALGLYMALAGQEHHG